MRDTIIEAVESDAAIRTRLEMQPAGGVGTKVFPPTYAGERDSSVYAVEHRKVTDGTVKECVLLDSVQSQANRMETALLNAWRTDQISLPIIRTDFTDDFEDIGKITTLDAPHRIADAIFRESTHEGTPFRDTPTGKIFERSSMDNAGPLYTVCPTALLFGAWDSTGQREVQRGATFPRAITSEIIGVGIEKGVDPTGRISPVDISGTDSTLYETESGQLTHNEEEAIDPDDAMKPSEANLGNVTPSFLHDTTGDETPGGVTMEYAELTAVISLSGLRRLAFPDSGESHPERTRAGRAALAALGLVAVAHQYTSGYALRSRCNLVAATDISFELVKRNGDTELLDLSPDDCVTVFNELYAEAAEYGLDWRFDTLDLTPTETLVEEIARSRNQVSE